jgi:signal transduction histidine kinase
MAAVAWRGRQPEHWPGDPAAYWAGETNWHHPLWPMRPYSLAPATLRESGGGLAHVLEGSGQVMLGRWTQPKAGWTWAMWVLPEPSWNRPGQRLVLAQAQEPEYQVELIWEDGQLSADHFWSKKEDRWTGPAAPKLTQSYRPGPLTDWIHLAVVSDDQLVRFYVDGNLIREDGVRDLLKLRNATLDLGPLTANPSSASARANFDDVVVFSRSVEARGILALARSRPGVLPRVMAAPEQGEALWRSGWPWVAGGWAMWLLLAGQPALRRALAAVLRTLPEPIYRPVWLVLAVELLLTAALATSVALRAARQDSERFEAEAQRFANEIRDNFLRIADLVNATRDWVATQPGLTPARWERWTESRSVEHDFPGLSGLGYAQKVLPADVAQAEAEWGRRYGFPFHIWPTDPAARQGRPERLSGEPLLPVVVYQPWHLSADKWRTNGSILGRDLLAPRPDDQSVRPEPVRIEGAIESGGIMSSGLLEIAPSGWYGVPVRGLRLYSAQVAVAPGDHQPLPEANWSGVAFASVDLGRWLDERLGKGTPQLGFRLFTGQSEERRHELAFDGGQFHPDAGGRPEAAHSATREIRLFHYRLWLDCWSSRAFEERSLRRWPWIITGTGSGLALLTAALLFVQVRGREKEAEGAAQLRAANVELARLNHDRERLSRDLHDGTIQSLYAVGLHLQHAQRHLPDPAGKTAQGLEEGQRLVQETIVELREFLLALKDEPLTHRSFAQTMDDLLARLRRTTTVEFALSVDPAAEALPARTVVHLVNVAREAISNAVRHGRSNHIAVTLQTAGSSRALRLEIQDDGRGFDPAKGIGAGFGLLTMRERAAELSGIFTVESSPGHGTLVRVEFPAN